MRTVRVATYNVRDLLDDNAAAARTVRAIAPDVLCLQEFPRWVTSLPRMRAFERASGRDIPFEVVARRPGDVAVSYADSSKANDVLGWRARHGIDDICTDAWRWQRQNPLGYESLPARRRSARTQAPRRQRHPLLPALRLAGRAG